jgi:hypothetical protein
VFQHTHLLDCPLSEPMLNKRGNDVGLFGVTGK